MASTSKSSDDTCTREETSEVRDSDETDGEDTDISDCSAAAVSSWFKQPNPSHLGRKWKRQCNPPVGMKRAIGRTVNDPKKVSATDQVKQFFNEHLLCPLESFFA